MKRGSGFTHTPIWVCVKLQSLSKNRKNNHYFTLGGCVFAGGVGGGGHFIVKQRGGLTKKFGNHRANIIPANVSCDLEITFSLS